MRGMAPTTSLVTSVAGYVAATGNHLAGRQALARWASSQPALRDFSTLAEVVAACRDGAPEQQDRVLGALLRVAHDDQLAQLTVISALGRKLGAAVSSWRRSGASPADLELLQADLVTRCWEVVAATAAAIADGAAPPPRLALELVGQAWDAFRYHAGGSAGPQPITSASTALASLPHGQVAPPPMRWRERSAPPSGPAVSRPRRRRPCS